MQKDIMIKLIPKTNTYYPNIINSIVTVETVFA